MKNNSVGCLVAAIIVIILVGLVGVALFLLSFNTRKVVAEHERGVLTESGKRFWSRTSGSGAAGGTLVLQRDEMRRLPVPEPGEDITRERFAAFMVDEDATALAREAFREVADGASVSWLLRTQNVSERNGALHGDFRLPWQVSHGNGTTSSAIIVLAEFTDESRAALLKLRRGDWVTLQGQLSFNGDSVVLKDARPAPAPDE